jgi:hypothetical protein
MSTISQSRNDRWHARPAAGRERPSLALRARVATHRDLITRRLAEGAEPGSSAELELRAAQLTCERRRNQLLRSLRNIIKEAHDPGLHRSRVVLINRAAVLDAEDVINAMIARLSYAKPVRPEGMAIVERIITNADGDALYDSVEPGTLRRLLLVATEALDPAPPVDGELALAA